MGVWAVLRVFERLSSGDTPEHITDQAPRKPFACGELRVVQEIRFLTFPRVCFDLRHLKKHTAGQNLNITRPGLSDFKHLVHVKGSIMSRIFLARSLTPPHRRYALMRLSQ